MKKMHSNNIFLSVIVPLYNEERRIQNLPQIIKYLKGKKFKSEVVLINDGSNDNTLTELRKILNFDPTKKKFRIISSLRNNGKGVAIRKGMLAAKGLYRLFTDVDLSTPIEEFDKFLPFLEKFDIVIGSRKRRGAKLIKRQSQLREGLGKGFTRLSQLILNLDLTDFTCGFKCFSAKSATEIFKRQEINRWGFDSEILYIAKKLGFSIKEVPVVWENHSETKVRLPKDVIISLSDLIRVRLNGLRGIYD